jgi:hypothetical protein
MDFDEIRKICRRRMESRRRRPDDERETLVPCPGCEGSGQISLDMDGPRRYRSVLCPWCDGNCTTDSFMIGLWKEHRKPGSGRS